MRALILALMMLTAGTRAFAADPEPFHAGVAHLTVPDGEPFDTTIWYPTREAEIPFQAGPFTLSAARDATIAPGVRFPVVLLSHGRRGSPLGHRQLAARLARNGYIVVAPTHIGDSSTPAPPRPQQQILLDRPRQAHLALEAALTDPRFAGSADPARVGAIGFSAGGYTVLVLAGAEPNLAHAGAYCLAHPEDRGSCLTRPKAGNADAAPAGMATRPEGATPGEGAAPEGTAPGSMTPWRSPHDTRIRAIVLMDPLAIPFDARSVASVHGPMLLFRPERDDYLSSAGALALAAALPDPPRQIVVPGSHFVFLDPCPPQVAETAVAFCTDAPGVDRTAVHQQTETAIIAFLRQAL